MRSDDFGFNESDVDNVDNVIDAINDAVSCANNLNLHVII